MTLLPALDRRVPPAAVAVLAAVCGAVFMAGSAVAVSRDGSSAKKPKAAAAPSAAPSATPSPSPSPTPSPTPKPKPKVDPNKPQDFIADLGETMPEYLRVPDKAVEAGPISVAKAASTGGNGTAQERQTLTALGFVRGHSRAWEADDTLVMVAVFQWKSSDAALTWVHLQRAARQTRGEAWTPKIGSSMGGCSKEDGDVYDSMVTAVGRRTYSVVMMREGNCKTHAEITKVAKVFNDYAKQLPK